MDMAIRYRFKDGSTTILVLVERCALGMQYFQFRTRILQVPAMDLERFRHTANRVALSFSPNMAGAFDRTEWVMQVAVRFRDQSDLAGFRKFFAFWVVEGRLELEAQRVVKQRLKEMDMPEIMEWFREEGIALGKAEGKAEGIREKAIEDTLKMREHGIDWAIVTDVTGIRPEDLNQ